MDDDLRFLLGMGSPLWRAHYAVKTLLRRVTGLEARARREQSRQRAERELARIRRTEEDQRGNWSYLWLAEEICRLYR